MSIFHDVKRFDLGDFALHAGGVLKDGFLTYSTHGALDSDRGNAILVMPSLMANRTRHDFLIGAGKAFDPDRHFIITVDTLGNGHAVSPSNSTSQPGWDFPRFTILDMVRIQHRLITEELGIERLLAVAGLSMGGMQALQWAVAFPDAMSGVVPIITQARATPWVSAYWHAMRQQISGEAPSREAFRSALYHFLLMTRHWEVFQQDFEADREAMYAWMDAEAQRLSQLWSPIDFAYQTFAEDDYDLAAALGGQGDYRQALAAIRARVLLLPCSTDLIHPASELHLALPHIADARLVEIASPCGHMGGGGLDAAAADLMNRTISGFLRDVAAGA